MGVLSMRLKKLHFVLLFGLVFLLWNFITYYTLTQSKVAPAGVREQALSQKLSNIEKELLKQGEENKKLLEDLRLVKKRNSEREQETAFKLKVQAVKSGSHRAGVEGKQDNVLPVLMIACDRTTVNRALDKLIEYRPSASKFPIIVSQDCGHAPTAEVIQKYVASHNITHIKQPDLSNIALPANKKKWVGYYKIARHYKWALDQIFVTFNYPAVIIVEDDLDISPDFYEYFSATYPLLKQDPDLWCVSAWNDNGKQGMVSSEAELLYRTDFFPGLGWMIDRELYLGELQKKWPDTFWDDWMRHPDQRKGRQCIRPEICRTSTFGKKGVSKGLFFEKHLKFIQHNTVFVPFSKMDLSYLLKANYDPMFHKKVYSAPVLTANQVRSGELSAEKVVRVEYTGKDNFKRQAKLLGIMDDFKAGVPRVAYQGVVSFMVQNRRVYLAPPPTWSGYDTTWS
ncbi:alpha-1,3-mannosyl-glycoprotein 2-beta-N-acetylglucosaminyltransferase [Elysia marginata]|uniref:Alpha-1,3-mannosyl-glycoprotein 2-beta-N-acetylglucosaminyltransferase n=1 Tax=Elysia marginata TaxID=1093978 RepID=A0AAV4IKU1_9GAST|nr:alpha-1,3-mannosyl-glycoprotein 2-beta-N-acetylglucosaminyltransferase [Elysia marginata]